MEFHYWPRTSGIFFFLLSLNRNFLFPLARCALIFLAKYTEMHLIVLSVLIFRIKYSSYYPSFYNPSVEICSKIFIGHVLFLELSESRDGDDLFGILLVRPAALSGPTEERQKIAFSKRVLNVKTFFVFLSFSLGKV